MALTKNDFEEVLGRRLAEAKGERRRTLDVNSGDLHREVGDYPGSSTHRMPICCEVMRESFSYRREVLAEPPKGQGATLSIRFFLD